MSSLSSAEIVFFLSCALFMGWQAFVFFRAVIGNDRAADATQRAPGGPGGGAGRVGAPGSGGQ